MADTINKQKLQLRSVVSGNGVEKNPPPATKLLINHGKPNFTIQRSTSKVSQNGSASSDSSSRPMSPEENNNVTVNNNFNKNDNYNPYRSANVNGKTYTNGNSELIIKSTKFNGVFKPTNLAATANNNADNEAGKVVLRRTARAPEPTATASGDGNEDDSVPEFIRRQRRIQERLAKENVLDFENRRSGYFTHVMISPTSASRTSFVETMASPAVVPSLEMSPPPQSPKLQTQVEEKLEAQSNGHAAEEPEKQINEQQTYEEKHVEANESKQEQQNHEHKEEQQTHEHKEEQQTHEHKEEQQTHEHKEEQIHEQKHEQIHEQTHELVQEHAQEQNHNNAQEQVQEHSHEQTKLEEEAEVAKAIEEVNKAVAGEEDAADEPLVTAAAVTTSSEKHEVVIHHEEAVTISHTNEGSAEAQTQQHASGALCINATNAQPYEDKVQILKVEHDLASLQNDVNIISVETQEPETHVSGALCINLPDDKKDATTITRQHSSGALVVNHEASEPVHFEHTIKSESTNGDVNKTEHTNGTPLTSVESVEHASGALVTNHEEKSKETKADEELQAMAKLKFDIKAEDAQNIERQS